MIPCISRRSEGFTLIELIAVLVILSILAVFAVPQVLDLRGDAWTSRHATNSTAFASAVSNARSLCKGFGNSGTTTINLAQVPPGTLDFNAECHPMGTDWSSGASSDANCAELFNALVSRARASVGSTAGFDYRANSAANYCLYYGLEADGSYKKTSDNSTQLRIIYYTSGIAAGRIAANNMADATVEIIIKED